MILRPLICIPTYNNAGTIADVVASALEKTSHAVLVVDDGSEQPVADLLQADSRVAPSLAQGRVQVLRLPENRGKGVALQSAFTWAVERGYTHLLTVDGDGQHLLSDAAKLLAAGVENPFDLIVGKRRLDGDHVPGVSRFGRRFSNFWVGYQTGALVEDSQSGYRLYPLFYVQNWRYLCKRYDFEIEVLIRLLWHGIGVREVEIDCYYPPADERVSHFDKLWDNVRISLLNTLLVVLALLRENLSPRKSGAAVGIGVMIGCSPFFGFHTVLAAGAALAFRLNAVLVFLGTNISLPPIALVLIPAEIAVGRTLVPHWVPFGRWLFGALVVGAALGSAAALVTWAVSARWIARRRQATNWTGKTRGGRLGNGFLKQVLRFCGLRTGYFFLFWIVPYFYLFAPRARRAAHEYWRVVRPEAGFWRRRALILRHLYRFGQVLMDRGLQSFSETARFRVNSHGMEHILEPIRKRQPLIMATAHVGGWDLAAALLCTEGFRGRMHMVHYQFNGLTMEKVMGRADHVNSLLANQDPILQVKLMLDRAEPVGLMADRASGNHYELVRFFGRLAPFDTRPFRIAAVLKCPLLVTFGFKNGTEAYDLYALEPRHYRFTLDRPRAEQVREWVQQYASDLQTMVHRYPEQWFNFYPFFSSRPTAPPGLQAGPERHSLSAEWRTPPMSAPASEADSKTAAATESPL